MQFTQKINNESRAFIDRWPHNAPSFWPSQKKVVKALFIVIHSDSLATLDSKHFTFVLMNYCKFRNYCEIFIFTNSVNIFAQLKNCDFGMIYLHQQRTKSFAISQGFYFHENPHLCRRTLFEPAYMRLWYLSHMHAVMDQIRAVLPEPCCLRLRPNWRPIKQPCICI